MQIEAGESRDGRRIGFPNTYLNFKTPRRGQGIGVIEAMGSVGKSKLAITDYAYQAERLQRPTLIIDYLGEHRMSKFANFRTRGQTGYGISHLHSVSNVVFKVSQFNKATIWASLGLPAGASSVLAELAVKYQPYHQDNFDTFVQMIEETPEQQLNKYWQEQHLDKFAKNWDLDFKPKAINAASKGSILQRVPRFKYIFWDVNDTNQTWFEDWGRALSEYGCLHVDMNLKRDEPNAEIRAQIVVGFILDQLQDYMWWWKSRQKVYSQRTWLEKLRPLIVIEEADKVFMPIFDSLKDEPFSVTVLKSYITKKMKFGVELIFITQNIKMLHQSIWDNWQWIMSGTGGSGSPLTPSLKWDIDANRREFIVARRGKWEHIPFSPNAPPTWFR